MLEVSQARAVAEQFGVPAGQVARDHLISQLLAAISTHAADEVTFFGGTALARTLLPGNRLSEDIDLIARRSRRDVAALLDDTLPRALRREFPGST
jgi:predicted nucleotidyltransferase component of viral defense system